MTEHTMTDKELDAYLDNGGDSMPFIIPDTVEHPNYPEGTRRINLNMPDWMIEVLDREANRLSISRQALIIVWLDERLKQEGLAG